MLEKIVCTNCSSKNVTKFGKRNNKFRTIQLYCCKNCGKKFSLQKTCCKSYPANVILNSILTYNLGYSLEETSRVIAKKYKRKVPLTTISSWLKCYKDVCAYYRLREEAKKLYRPNFLIFSKKFYHEQVYKFQVHKAKLDLLLQDTNFSKHKRFLPVKDYLEKIPTENFPHHIFRPKKGAEENLEDKQEFERRSSQLKMGLLPVTKLSKNNLANKLAGLALQLAKMNKERHEKVQEFMLVNDSVTVAVEVPVYLTHDDIEYFRKRGFVLNFEDYRTPITGHIDVLQVRNNMIHILDYNPEAEKEKKAVRQLTIYALALASRTKLPISYFKCAWFDEKNYFEFFPLHCVYKNKNERFKYNM